MKKIIVVLFFALLIGGCSSNTKQWQVLAEKWSWETLENYEVTNAEVNTVFKKIEKAFSLEEEVWFNMFLDEKIVNIPVNKLSKDVKWKVNYSFWFSDDSIEYTLDWEKQEYKFPYSKDNAKKLKSAECDDEQMFDTILCYMPRVNAVYWPFDNVFAEGKQLIYLVSAYQSLSSQHIVDLSTKVEFPRMDQLHLLYATPDRKSVIATTQGESSLYKDLLVFSEWSKDKIFEWPINVVFFDWETLFSTTSSNSSNLSDLKVFDYLNWDEIFTVNDIDLWERAVFSLDEDKLYVYYVEVSFIQEEEFYYVKQVDRLTWNTDWVIKLSSNFTFDQ